MAESKYSICNEQKPHDSKTAQSKHAERPVNMRRLGCRIYKIGPIPGNTFALIMLPVNSVNGELAYRIALFWRCQIRDAKAYHAS